MTLKTHLTTLLNDADNSILRDFFFDQITEDDLTGKYTDEDTKAFLQSLKDLGISFKSEDHYGGEGQGEDYWTVYSFTLGDEKVYVDFYGSYYSYDGANYDDWSFAEPHPVQKIEWGHIS